MCPAWLPVTLRGMRLTAEKVFLGVAAFFVFGGLLAIPVGALWLLGLSLFG